MELKELTAIDAVSGDEARLREVIVAEAKRHCDEVRVDRMGNVLAFRKGSGDARRHVMLSAHMDEVGLMVRGIRDDGLIAYATVGAIDPRVMVSKRVFVGADRVPGVVGYKAPHLQTSGEAAKPAEHKSLFIDIGAADKRAAEQKVKPGDFVSLDGAYRPFGDGFVRAKALDDRVGVYNLLRLMKTQFPVDVTYAFTVQEEIGLRGAGVAARGTDAAMAVILEGTTANDLGMVDAHQRVTEAGQGVAISFMDRSSIAHPGLNRRLRQLADERGIPWQVKRAVAGGNDAGTIQTARGAIMVCVLSVPCRYIHSPASVCHLDDIEAQYRLAEAFLAEGATMKQEENAV